MFRLAQIHRFAAVATIAAVLALAASSCLRQGEELRRLTAIEPLLEHNPDSARVLLDGIDPTGFRGESLALYALLKTQADYKCYVDIPSDSLIRKATAYYGTRRKGYHAAMSWYSLGCVNEQIDNNLIALDNYLKAKDLFPDTLVKYYALCLQNMGYLYMSQNLYKEAESCFSTCLAHPYCTSPMKVYYNVLYNKGLCAMNSNNLDLADSIIRHLLCDSLLPSNHRADAYFQLAKISMYRDSDYQKAIEYCDTNIMMLRGKVMVPAAYSQKGEAYLAMGMPDSAYNCFLKSLEDNQEIHTKCSVYYHLAVLSSMLEKETAPTYMDIYRNLRDSIGSLEQIKKFEEIRAKYNIDVLIARHQMDILYIAIISLGLVVALTLWYYRRIILNRLKLNETNIQMLQSEVHELADKNSKARNVMTELYRQHIEYCKHQFETTDEAEMLSRLMIQKQLEYNISYQDRNSIKDKVSECFQVAISDIKMECPSMSKDDGLILILLYLGCNHSLIAELYSVSREAVRKRIYRWGKNKELINLYNSTKGV